MPVIEKTTFNELKQMSGDDFINELIDTFLEDAPKMIAELQTSLAAKEAEGFRREGHAMKSNANTFGASALAALAKELEMLGKEQKLSEAGGKLKALEEACASACEELKRLKS